MTKQEVLKRYKIPPDLLEQYREARHCLSFRESDIEAISMIMTLYDAGFNDGEVKEYMTLLFSEQNTVEKRMAMLVKKRKETLEDLHSKQKQLDGIDYLRYQMLKES